MIKGKLFILLCLALILSIIVSCGSPFGNPESVVKVAFEEWIQNYGVPYKDVRYETINNDGTYATVSVFGYFRENSESDWIEMQTYVEVKKVGSAWKCEDNQFYGLNPKTNSESLMEACSLGYIEEVKKFLNQGVDINEKSDWGYPPLGLAIKNNHTDIARLLIENGADVNAELFLLALNSKNFEIAGLLIEKGIDINAKNKDGRTLLMDAADVPKGQGYEKVYFLIENGADVNAKNEHGSGALWSAIFWGDYEIVSLLIENGADVNAENEDGYTVLCHAVREGRLEMVSLLIENGADVNAKDKDGDTALSTAKYWGEDKIVNLLIENGAHE